MRSISAQEDIMKRSTRSFAKKASNLYRSIHQQLSMHAIAVAVVVVVSVLALAPPAEAKIAYTPADVVVSCENNFCDQQYNLDLNHDGVTDFTIEVKFIIFFLCQSSRQVGELPASGNGAIGGSYPLALKQGAPIGHSQQFQGSRGTMAFYAVNHECSPSYGGLWYNAHAPVTAYLGLRFQLNGRAHYGWAKLTVEGASYAKLTGYAYETIAGKAINAGQTKEADDPTNEDLGPGASLTSPIPDTPQPASLGMLALGAQGVPIWRRKESALQGDLKGAS
jgi:hypothetical protein